ncbi:MAG: hypothetical protein JWN83_1694 [Chitinophagaceae bacterium]|nr:hypothetical protein [Ferruginibacter sp.]MDB5223027.1 hypothetical protein [Chitinophagaceae bacterium]
MKKTLFICLCIFLCLPVCKAQFLSDWTKNYSTDCAKCGDPWVGELYYKIWGRCPSTVGGNDNNCNIYVYNNASWTSYDNLQTIIRNKYTGARSSGYVYIFIKPENVAGLGHIGWGFQISDGNYFCGATENYAKGDIRTYIVLAGYNNDFWSERDTKDMMFAKMKSLGYSRYKSLSVNNPTLLKAKLKAEYIKMNGFQGISNNCLDHTFQILEAYGIPWYNLPSRQIYLTPNKWFTEFYKSINGGDWGYAL